MKIKEIHAKAGPWVGHLGYFLLVFVWYLFENIYGSQRSALPQGPLTALFEWGFRLLIVPAILAGVFGGIHERQKISDEWSTGGFFSSIKKYYWRVLAANMLSIIFYIITVVILVVAGLKVDSEQARPLVVLITSPFSTILLFWFSAMVVENNFFQGLLRGLKTFLSNPYALVIGIFWMAVSSIDNIFFDIPESPASLLINIMRAGVVAAVRIVTIAYVLSIYKQARGDVPEPLPQDAAAQLDLPSSSGDGWVRASFGLAFLSFLPMVNFLALILGIIALWRKKRFVIRAVIACCAGGFFTIFYFLIVAGFVVGSLSPSESVGFGFLAEANPAVKQQVALLENGSSDEIRQQLEQNTTDGSDHHWTVDAISALARYGNRDFDNAFNDFQLAAAKKPERSEFYYYYGLALLDDRKTEAAAAQFRAALAHAPKLEAAQRRLDLINAAYKPPVIVSGLLSIIVLLILFTLHELGHAYAAWKLGDDTAKNLGRLTLNPIAHLDLFGSIILPGILIWQQAGVVFGWAKPVPINPENFQNPKKDQVRVSFAGPAVNLVISIICFVILGFLMLFMRLLWPNTLTLNLAVPYEPVSIIGPPIALLLVLIVVFLKQVFYTSLVLGFFNLLPVPPLDGSWILSGLLPGQLSVFYEKTRKFGFLIFFLLVLTNISDSFLSIPLSFAWAGLEILVSVMRLG